MGTKIHSSNITFIDLTDSKKVDVHIASNLPTVQIFDGNANAQAPYSPDWTNTPLVLELTAYADSTSITSSLKSEDIIWYYQVGSGDYIKKQDGGTTLTISQNDLGGIGKSAGVISYICSIKYNNKTFEGRATFARIDTGINGAAGKDGTGVSIKGTATSAALVQGTDYYTITYADTAITAAQEGDAYLYNGDLYVCVGARDGADYFINVGRIQGPAGKDGTSAKMLLLNGSSQVFKFGAASTTPSPSAITVTAQRINIPAESALTWYYNGSATAPDGVSRNGDVVTISGSTLKTDSLTITVTDGTVQDTFTVYKASDGKAGATGQAASMAFLTNENVSFAADASGKISATTIYTNVVAYNGTTKTKPTIGTILNLPTGMTATSSDAANNEVTITFTIENGTTFGSTSSNNGLITIPITSPVNTNLIFSWSKVNAGAQGPQGNKGNDSYTVLLTNESHVFAGDVSNAVGASTSTQVLAYNGSAAQSVTISSVNGKTASTTDTDTGIAGLKFKCSSLSGTSPTITFTCTTAFVSASGTIPIVLSVGGISFTKIFTYSIAFKGNTGGTGAQGPQGEAATSYWLISSASVVHKTSTGTSTVTPSTLTFTGKSTTGENTPFDYACRWLIDYSTDGTSYTNLYTSTSNETSKTISVTTNYKTIRARMYMAGGTTVLLDEQIIPVVSDGVKGDTGAQGTSVTVSKIEYQAGTSATTAPTGTWSTSVVSAEEGNYLWTKTTFSDGKIAYGVAKQGVKGDQGVQGPRGNDGQQYYTWVKYADTPTSGMSDNPDGKAYIGLAYNKTTATESTTYSDYMWSLIKGETGAVGPKGNDGQQYYTWIKYADNASGANMSDSPSGKSYIGLAYNKTTSTESNTASDYTWALFKGDKGDTGNAGRGVSSIKEQYYQSTSATTQSGGSWSDTVPTWADGKYIWTRSVITYTDNTTTTTSPVCVTGQKGGTGGTGAAGVGVSSVDVWYYQSTSATSLSGGSWSTTSPSWVDGKYIWTKTITTYTNNTTDETSAVCITGQKGSTGVGIKSVTEYYLATSSNSGVTSSTTGWTTAIQTITADKKYLWNYEVITYTDNTTSTTSPIIIGAFGNTGSAGATGKGIKSVTEYYLATTLSTGVTTSTTGWSTTMQTMTATNKYLWNYELITYTDNSTATINPVIIGIYGDKGDKGNQGDRGAGISSVTVTYGTSTAASTQPTSWQTTLPTVAEGSYLWTRTVTDYTDASIADTVTLTYAKQGAKGSTGSAGTSVTVSSIQYQAGTSATTAPTGTWSNSVVTVAEGSYLWTKTTFSDGKIAYGVAKQGAKGSAGINAVTFQIYAPNGYLLSNELDSLTLQTFAYDGSNAITTATYVWSYQENDAWVTIADETTSSLTLTQDDVIKSKTYRCAMTYKNTTYYATATVQDKTDIYDVMICVSDNINPLTGIYYWVVYALLYSEQGEADALLGPISTTAPESPASGDYWYSVDAATQKVILKQYNGSAWVASTDKQTYVYDWRQIVDGTQQQAIGNTDKVQIISCNSFTSNATFQCIVTDTDGSKLARCNIHLTDTSDPIVSATAPVGVKDGQLWMQTQTDGTFLLHIWDADTSTWKQLNADTKNVVHTTKPSSYKAGDLWVVESDTAISGYTKGTLLQSNATATTFAAAHWTPSLKYEKELSDVQNTLKSYRQYMNVDENGLHMQARDANGTLSPFQALFTNTRLSFYQDDLEVAYISDNKLNIYEANIDVVSVEKKIQLQKFEWAIESNGSMSLIVNY